MSKPKSLKSLGVLPLAVRRNGIHVNFSFSCADVMKSEDFESKIESWKGWNIVATGANGQNEITMAKFYLKWWAAAKESKETMRGELN